ncbi:MAG: stage IV sporulation protein A [Lachnospiraceae bacterium]|nr:stage IV sporulation protein A [Lachnospiraceae bacterium]
MDADLYKDMKARTGGEFYLGVVGPVRTGKSTFIKRFMDVCVLPGMEDEYDKKQAMDELPQSAGGRTITTTEPKFVPKEAAKVRLSDEVSVLVKLIDCVGFMIEGAGGHMEDGQERMVKTPWFSYEIPFTQAADVGTQKVINDHATIGIVITTDGSFGEIPRENYEAAENRTIEACQKIGKPFLVIINSARPYGEEAQKVQNRLKERYGIHPLILNCEQLKQEDIHKILEQSLYEFPLTQIAFHFPGWLELLPKEHICKADIIAKVRELMEHYTYMRDFLEKPFRMESEYVTRAKVDEIDMSDGSVSIYLDVDDTWYYQMLSEMLGEEIDSERKLLAFLSTIGSMKEEYGKVLSAMESVRQKGYGVVMPGREEIRLEQPEIIRHGNKFGVKIKAQSPSIHLIRANIETEIAPIVGTQKQAEDLIQYISDTGSQTNGIWETNIFGKTVEQLVSDGISGKIAMIGEESQMKLQESMQKIVNDTTGGIVCIII